MAKKKDLKEVIPGMICRDRPLLDSMMVMVDLLNIKCEETEIRNKTRLYLADAGHSRFYEIMNYRRI